MSLKQRLEQINEKVEESTKKINDPYYEFKNKILINVIEELEIDFKEISDKNQKMINEISYLIDNNIEKEDLNLTSNQKSRIREELINEIIGFGPISDLLKDNEITEIMVNGPNSIYIEKHGKLQLTDVKFKNNDHVIHVIKKIVSPLGRRIDEKSPMVDARLPNGSRVNAIIPPLAIDGPSITIRKFSEDPYNIEDLINFGTLNSKMAEFLKMCVKGKLNIIVSGGTGSGKTTSLNVISSFISEDERIVTIEDSAELQLTQKHVVRLETRSKNIEGSGEISIRDLVKNSLRMRPDRIIIGEVRSAEALDMLQAMNTGHDGSLTTGHANTPRDILSRLETMVLMAGLNLPIIAIRNQISSAINLIVQQSRMMDGTRRITHITEVQGMEGEIITLQDIFLFKQNGVDSNGKVLGEFISTGIKPKFFKLLNQRGINSSSELFSSF
ncbi:CpaF family protein [Helicovermis profundi]|uniref:CpaF family protein n=1 Tax=Helicovermis profundi TaxID=3065157 RepID=A0AAU9EE77_9FIRM|nr:CpaF family protein [Clostridia bacterium S502]